MVLMERMKGQTLEAAWPTLSETEKETVADPVAEVPQLRFRVEGSERLLRISK
jgi:hypothetical protein